MSSLKNFFSKKKKQLIIVAIIVGALSFTFFGYSIGEYFTKSSYLAKQIEAETNWYSEKGRLYTYILRGPMLSDDVSEVKIIAKNLLEKSSVNYYEIVNAEGIIIASNDKMLIGKNTVENLSELIKQEVLNDKNHIKVITPIMGIDENAGALILKNN